MLETYRQVHKILEQNWPFSVKLNKKKISMDGAKFEIRSSLMVSSKIKKKRISK